MKRIFLLFMFLGTSANAATMCAPDLSTCESCTDGTYDGITWTRNCCGTQVSGIAVGMEAKDGQYVKKSVVLTDEVFVPGRWFCLCVMTSPIVAPYAVAGNTYCGINTVSDCAVKCAARFSPKCAFTECTDEYYCMD